MESYGNLNSFLIRAVKTDELLTAAAIESLLGNVCHKDHTVTVGDTVHPDEG